MIRLNNAQSLFLDVLRVLSVQMVVIGHALSFFGIAQINYVQNTAVVIFFILSGIVISYSTFSKIEGNNSYRFRDFFIDRFSRIYAGLIPSLLFIIAIDNINVFYNGVASYQYLEAFNLKTFLGNIVMIQDHPIDTVFTYFGWGGAFITSFGSGRPLWTLAIEWWLYLSFGMIMINYIKSFSKKYFLILCLFLIVPLFNSFTGRGDSLTLFWLEGVIITVLLKNGIIKVNKYTAMLAAGITLMLVGLRLIYTYKAYDLVYVTFISLFILSSMLFFKHDEKPYLKVRKVVSFFASYSFTLYLIHYSIFDFIVSLSLPSFLSTFFSAILISNIISLLIAYYTEMRYRKFGYFIREKLNLLGVACVKR